jgi:two-component system, HptB-dependent secretion and biofilm response regulator
MHDDTQISARLREHNAPPSNETVASAISGTRLLTLLLVEDDQLCRELLLRRIQGLFKSVVVATDGTEGFRLFCEHRPDLVLTDQVMPNLTGLGLLGKIRATGALTPVVLMTVIDEKVLLEAINGGIERFVPKPFDFMVLLRTLTSVTQQILNERLKEQHRIQEVKLLRYRDAYNSMQQESAQRKERHIVRHDLRNQVLMGGNGARWAMKVAHSPHDIMCGDGYSVRRIFDGRLLVFIVDAMGSGMSASLTAMLTTSFFNYQVEYLHLWKNFTLRIFLARFQEYLSSILLPEEVLSCGFFLMDLEREEIEAALCALPPLLLRGVDGTLSRVRGENPPIGSYPKEIRISTLSLSGVSDLLFMTDGISDALLAQGGSYREVLDDDFRTAPTLKAFQRRFAHKTLQGTLDDLTLMHLLRLDFAPDWSWQREPELTLAGLGSCIAELLQALTEAAHPGPAECDEVQLILTEALTNALEHGCLGIDRRHKARLLLSGEYDDLLEAMAPLPGAGITLRATLWRGAGKPLLHLEVRDCGPGFAPDALRHPAEGNFLNGRGLQMIERYCDSFFTDGPGGRLIILKTLEGADHHAD